MNPSFHRGKYTIRVQQSIVEMLMGLLNPNGLLIAHRVASRVQQLVTGEFWYQIPNFSLLNPNEPPVIGLNTLLRFSNQLGYQTPNVEM